MQWSHLVMARLDPMSAYLIVGGQGKDRLTCCARKQCVLSLISLLGRRIRDYTRIDVDFPHGVILQCDCVCTENRKKRKHQYERDALHTSPLERMTDLVSTAIGNQT